MSKVLERNEDFSLSAGIDDKPMPAKNSKEPGVNVSPAVYPHLRNIYVVELQEAEKPILAIIDST